MGTGLNALGERQVNFTIDGSANGLAGTQADPAVTALANGDFLAVYENPQVGDSLLAHFYDANGHPILPPVPSGLLTVVGIDPAPHISVDPAVTATPDGGFLVAYTDTSVSATNPVTKAVFEANGIDVRRYDNTTGLSASFVIDTGGGPIHPINPGTVSDAAIAAFADGTSVIVWDFDYNADPTDDDVYFAFLNSTASDFATISGVVHGPRPLTIANGFEGEPSVATSGNLAAIVYAADPGHKQGDQDIILTAFNSSATQLVPPTTIFGATSLDVFSHPDVATLSDGRFVIVARNDTTSSLVASIFDPVTRAVTPINFSPAGTNPHVAGTPGGGFVVSFDSPSGDVIEDRFGPGGSGLFNAGVANSFTTGIQDQNAIAANGSGTVFAAWQDASSGNPNSTDTDTRIEAQSFHLQLLPPLNFNGDGESDILWQNDGGQAAIWLMNGTTAIGGASAGADPGPSWHVKPSGDFNGDGKSDILWQNDSGQATIWLMNGTTPISGAAAGANPGPSWHVIDSGDFNGDGKGDILWQNDSGQAAIWLMDGTTQIGASVIGANPGPSWRVKASGDFNGDGKSDILWQNDSGQAAIWLMDGTTQIGAAVIGANPGPSWRVKASGDFNGDGKSDILWQNDSGQASVWLMDGTTLIGGATAGANPGPSWHIKTSGDFNGDGKSDILWQNDSGQASVWLMDGTTPTSAALVGANPGSGWRLV